MENPFFSIIVPIYKIDKNFLKECIESILSQSFENFELILVDDGSPDNSGQICDDYAKQDNRIKVLHQVNQGVSVARNNGIEYASGEWLMFADADDWLEYNACEILYNRICEQDCEILKFRAISELKSSSKLINCEFEDGRVYDLKNVKEKEFVYRCTMKIPDCAKQLNKPVYYSWDKVYKRSFLIFHDIKYPVGIVKSEDKIFFLNCTQKLSKLYCISDALYHYRMNENSVCHSYSQNIDKDRLNFAKLLEDTAKQMNEEIAGLFQQPSYNKIIEDYERFLFGIISDVLCLKFYHKDNPNKLTRRREAIEFLETEPFKTLIDKIPYSSLSYKAKLKKILLKYKLVTLFCLIKK